MASWRQLSTLRESVCDEWCVINRETLRKGGTERLDLPLLVVVVRAGGETSAAIGIQRLSDVQYELNGRKNSFRFTAANARAIIRVGVSQRSGTQRATTIPVVILCCLLCIILTTVKRGRV